MSIPGAGSPLFLSAAAADAAAGYQIDRSLRFNDGDSPSLSRTVPSAGNQKKWTWSGWFKRGSESQPGRFFSAGPSSTNRTNIFLYPRSSNKGIGFYSYVNGSLVGQAGSDPVLADHSAWYHLVFAFDAANSTTADRLKVYINGVEHSITYNVVVSNIDHYVSGNTAHYVGKGADGYPFDGYLAEVHFVDGQALAPTDFGAYDSNNVWQPKEYSGSYGTNGFYLKFANNGSNAGLGTDSSGNSNTFTVNNLSAREEKWSDYLTSTASFTANQGPDKAFDNSLSGPDVPYNDSGAPMTWTPPGGLAYFSKVEIYVGGISGFTYSLNGATAVSATINSWNTVATGSGTINTLVFDRSSGETHGPHAIRVDNVVLVDGTPSNTDSLIDTPTNYTADSGNNGGNYSTMNPLLQLRLATLSNGNLDVTGGSYTDNGWGTIAVPSGKWYAEVTVTAGGGSTDVMVGVKDVGQTGATDFGAVSRGYGYSSSGQKCNSDSLSSYAASYTNGDVIGIALDLDAGTITFYKNGSSQGAAFSGISSSYSYHFCSFTRTTSDKISWNFGQRPFAYTAPSNHLAVCTTNLPDPTIADGSTAMDIVTYSGDGTNGRAITGLGFSPDLVWIKARNQTDGHNLFDIVRGATKVIKSNNDNVELTESNSLTAFNSDGFTVGSNSSNAQVNSSGFTYVGWAWDGGTSTVSNTDGNITSNVRANQSAGFSIVSYQGNGVLNSTVGHGLNAAPSLVIIKGRSYTQRPWLTLHTGAGLTGTTLDGSAEYYMLRLNLTNARADLSQSQIWEPTSSTFKINNTNTNAVPINGNGEDYIAYCWAPVEGYSAFGSYDGNGNANGVFVYTGFEVAYLVIKCVSHTSMWSCWDTTRDVSNPAERRQKLDDSRTEESGDSNLYIDLLSNGFKTRVTDTDTNGSGRTYVYMAFASHPLKTARAR